MVVLIHGINKFVRVYNLHPVDSQYKVTTHTTALTLSLPLLAPPFNKRVMAFYVYWSPFDREREREREAEGGERRRGVRPSIIISRLTRQTRGER